MLATLHFLETSVGALGSPAWACWAQSKFQALFPHMREVGALGFGSLQLFMEAFNIQGFRLCLNSSKCLCCKGRSHLLLRGVAGACGKNHLLGSAEFPSLSGLPGTISHFPFCWGMLPKLIFPSQNPVLASSLVLRAGIVPHERKRG